MIKFISRILRSLFVLLVSGIIFIFLFSLRSNMTVENTISYFKTIGKQILNIEDSENVVANLGTEIITTSSNNHYYYEQLDENSKIIYAALENNIDNLIKENYVIDFSTTFNDLLHEPTGQYKLKRSFQSALDAFYYDHPELFYIDITKMSITTNCISVGPLKTYMVKITPVNNKNYLDSGFSSEYDVNYAISKVEKIKTEIINTVSNEKDTYNKIKMVHDILATSIEYDSTISKPNIYNIYGALVQKTVVCEGYAKAFKYILDSLNIDCILVVGNGINSSNQTEDHMWNYVKLNNSWYGVDVTWDDPIIIGGNTDKNLRHDYFLKGASSFNSSHNASGRISDTGMLFSVPTLTDSNYRW